MTKIQAWNHINKQSYQIARGNNYYNISYFLLFVSNYNKPSIVPWRDDSVRAILGVTKEAGHFGRLSEGGHSASVLWGKIAISGVSSKTMSDLSLVIHHLIIGTGAPPDHIESSADHSYLVKMTLRNCQGQRTHHNCQELSSGDQGKVLCRERGKRGETYHLQKCHHTSCQCASALRLFC